MKTVQVYIEQENDTPIGAFAAAAMAASGYVVSKGKKHGRRSTSVDNAFDSFANEIAAVENRRVLAHAIASGELAPVDADGQPTTTSALKWGKKYNGKERVDQYDAIKGMCTADERFRPTVDSTLKLGNRVKACLDEYNAEIRLADIKLFVEKYIAEVYLKSDDVSSYLKIDDLNPQEVEDISDALDSAQESAA